MSGLLSNQKIDIPCPECNKKHSKTIAWLKMHRQFACIGCRRIICVDSNELLRLIKQIQSGLTDVSRNFTIKF